VREDVANEMLEAARQHIRASGHPLLITSEAVAERGENDRHREYGLRGRDPDRDCRARRCRWRGVRATLLLRAGERSQCRALLSRQGSLARWRRGLSGTHERRHGPKIALGSARGRHPGAIDPQGYPALRAARNRQDPYHSLSGEQPARSHHPDDHGSPGRIACPVHESRPPSAANDGRDRGRRSDRARSQRDGTSRGIAA
jgi:hypothetical protein